jgi:hypothetical protein
VAHRRGGRRRGPADPHRLRRRRARPEFRRRRPATPSGLCRATDEQQRQIDQNREQQRRLRDALARQSRPPQTPAGPNATSFNDGLYQVGVAIQPGQYETDGSDSCYWAKLSTGDTNRVIVNHLGAGPQTVTIDSPYFESEGCGTWTKVG